MNLFHKWVPAVTLWTYNNDFSFHLFAYACLNFITTYVHQLKFIAFLLSLSQCNLNKHKKKINMSIKSMFKLLYIAELVLKVKKTNTSVCMCTRILNAIVVERLKNEELTMMTMYNTHLQTRLVQIGRIMLND